MAKDLLSDGLQTSAARHAAYCIWKAGADNSVLFVKTPLLPLEDMQES